MSSMKRLLVFALFACLLFCGCKADTPTSADPAEEPTQEQTQTPAENTPETEAAPEETDQTSSEKVTVYLLDQSFLYDSGHTEYKYDQACNIDSYTVFTLENEPMYTAYFEEKDNNGMACQHRVEWPDDMGGDTRSLTYFADGKLKEEQYVGSNYSGYQYEYDQKGDMIQKREYYDGILETIVYYEYDGETLIAVYCEDKAGNRLFDCLVENGLITEKICYDSESQYSYLYEYDSHNNLIEMTMLYDGESIPCEQYSYKAVEVDADRAGYLLSQQRYLLPIV